MIKSEVHKGLIKRGLTKLNLTINIEQTGPMSLTVLAGTYTDVGGSTFALTEDIVLNFVADGEYKKDVTVSLVKNKATEEVEIWMDEVLGDGLHAPADIPIEHELLLQLVGHGWFIIPPNTTDLSSIDIYCMKVIE